MGAEPPRTGLSAAELAYYRAVEDHFARLRGTSFLFTPKDFALLRRWWSEGVPLAAVLAGIGEVVQRRRATGGDPVSSLHYCRHAVTRHTRRLAAAKVGEADEEAVIDVPEALRRCAASTREAGERWRHVPAVAGALVDLALAIESLPTNAPLAALDETVAGLEKSTLLAAEALLPADLHSEIAAAGDEELVVGKLSGEVKARTLLALRVQRMRSLLGLPRLELSAVDS